MRILRRRKVRIEVTVHYAIERTADGVHVSVENVSLPGQNEACDLAQAALVIPDAAAIFERHTRSRISEGLVRVHGARDNAIRYHRLVGATRFKVQLQADASAHARTFRLRNGREEVSSGSFWWSSIHEDDLAILQKDAKSVLASAEEARTMRPALAAAEDGDDS